MTPFDSYRQRPAARSYLFVPGDRPERFDKAWSAPADDIIIDLEDAVPPPRKAAARDAIAGWLCAARPVWLRLNSGDSEWFGDDLALLARHGIAGVMLPKAEAIAPALAALCEQHGLPIIALVETALGLRRAEQLAAAPNVVRLAFGSLDFQVDLGIEGDDDGLLFFRSQLVLASRLGGLAAPIDGVTPAVDDAAALRADTHRSRRLGFGAKLCIHPRQIDEVHRVFSPSGDERAWAQRVQQAMRDSNGAAVALDGKMIDRPVLLKAERILAAPAADGCLRAL
ncbi:MAG: aldolase [Lautropia sp. SCN 66-9]|nr:MAG: aldolase [Lautropia sp. SCN 66-9]